MAIAPQRPPNPSRPSLPSFFSLFLHTNVKLSFLCYKNGEDAFCFLFQLSVSNRHFGSKGAKLMLMEMKFGNDERFRLSEKFIEDGDQDEVIYRSVISL